MTPRRPNYRWFTDGELNVSWNCLDVHLEERGHKTALIFEGEPGDTRRLTYRELHAEVCRFANALQSRGREDAAIASSSTCRWSPEAIIAMHACARIGAIHSVVFGGFSALSLQGPHRGCRRERAHHRRWRPARRQHRRVEGSRRQGAGAAAAATIEQVIVLKRTGQDVPMKHGPRRVVARRDRRPVAGVRARCGSTPNIRCSCSIPPAPRASPRASSIRARAICSARSSPASGCSICAMTMSSGVPPMSAGSPATATSPTGRWPPAPRWCMYEGAPTYPDAGRFWQICQTARRHDLLHRAHRHPRAHEARR